MYFYRFYGGAKYDVIALNKANDVFGFTGRMEVIL